MHTFSCADKSASVCCVQCRKSMIKSVSQQYQIFLGFLHQCTFIRFLIFRHSSLVISSMKSFSVDFYRKCVIVHLQYTLILCHKVTFTVIQNFLAIRATKRGFLFLQTDTKRCVSLHIMSFITRCVFTSFSDAVLYLQLIACFWVKAQHLVQTGEADPPIRASEEL